MNKKLNVIAAALASASLLSACGDNEDSHAHMMSYTISLTNISANQPLTPPALILHGASYTPWSLGASASTALEKLAEGGDSADFIAEANSMMALATSAGTAIIAPGASASFTMSIDHSDDVQLSVASMLANSNDAFTGLHNLDLSEMAAGASQQYMLNVMDAGTEANTEASGTIPGPADGGTGYDMARDDLLNQIRIHAGVVSMDDGLSSSVLNETHRWTGSVAKLEIIKM